MNISAKAKTLKLWPTSALMTSVIPSSSLQVSRLATRQVRMPVPSMVSDNRRRFCHLLGIAQLATFLFSHGSNAKLWSLLLRSFHASRRYSKSTARKNCRFPVFRNCLVRTIHLTILMQRSLKRRKMIRYLSCILPALQVTKLLLLFPSPANYLQVFQNPLYTRITLWRASQM